MNGSFGFDGSGENYYYNTNESHEQNTSDSQILEEEYDPNYEPGLDDIREYARYLGMNEDTHQRFFWIAREGLRAPLPKCWKPCRTDTNEVYYFNFESGQSSWEHPCDLHYKELFAEALEMEKRGEKMPLPPGAKHVAYVDPDEETHPSQDKLSLPEDSEYNDDFEQSSFAEKTLGKSTGELIGAVGALKGKTTDFTDVQFEEDFADHETDTKVELGGATGLDSGALGAGVDVRGNVAGTLIPEEADTDYTTEKSIVAEHVTGLGAGADQTGYGAGSSYGPSHTVADAYGADSGYAVGVGVGINSGVGDSGLSQTTPEKSSFGKKSYSGKTLNFPEASESFDEHEYASHRASLLREHDMRMEDMVADLHMWEERLQRSLERREVRVAAAEAERVGGVLGEESEGKQVEADLKQLRGEYEALRSDTEALRSERDALRAEVESMDAEVTARRHAHEAEMERASATGEEEKAALIEQQRQELAALREDHAVEREAMEARMEQLAVDEEDYEARVRDVEERFLALNARVEELQRREEAVREREHDLSERENVISEQEHQIEEREQEILEKEKDISEREKALLEKNSDLSDFETSLAAKEQELMEREAALHRKTSALGNLSEMEFSGSEVPSAASLVSGPVPSSVVALQERIRVLEAENEHATRALVEAEDAVEALRGDTEPLRSELTVLRARESELAAEVEREKKEKEKLEVALATSGRANLQSSENSEIEDLKAECTRLRDSISASERRCVQVEASLSTTRSRCDQLQTALQDAEEQLKHQRAAAVAASEETAQHQRTAAREAAARAEIEAENARMLARLSAQRGNEADSAELVRVQQELQACRRMKAEVEADLVAAKADATRAARECERVSGECDAAKADARRAREEVRLVEESMGAIRGQVRVQQEEVLRVNAELATVKSELARVQADRDNSVRKLEETDALSERRYRSLLEAEDRARAAERKSEELEMRVRMSERKAEDAAEGLRTMERRCVEAERRCVEADERVRASERQCREWQARVVEVEERARAMERASDGAGASMGALAKVHGANNSHSNPTHTTAVSLSALPAAVTSDCCTNAARVSQLQRHLAEAEARVDVLQAQVRARTSESARVTDELQLLQERLDRTREQLVRAQAEAEELRSEVARRQSENNTVKMDLRDAKDEYERQARDTARARSEVARVQAECDRLAAEVTRLQTELRTHHAERQEQDAMAQRLQQRLAAVEAKAAQSGVQGCVDLEGADVPVSTAATAPAMPVNASTATPNAAAATATQKTDGIRTSAAETHAASLGSPTPVHTSAFTRGSGTPARPSFASTPTRAPQGSSLRGLLNGSLLSKYDTVLMSDHVYGNGPALNANAARDGVTEQDRGHLLAVQYAGVDEHGSGPVGAGDQGSAGAMVTDRGSYTASQPISRTLAWEAENDTVMATSLLKTPVRHPPAASVSTAGIMRGVVKPPAEPRSVADYLDVWASRELAMIAAEREYLQTYKYQLLSVQSAMKERQAQWTKQRAELKMALHSGVAESTLRDQHEMLNRQRLELDGLASHINADIDRYKRAKESVLVREQMVQAMLQEGKQMGFSQTQAASVGNLHLSKEDLGLGVNFPDTLKNSHNSQLPQATSALSDLDREMIAMVAATAAASESSKLLSQILSRVQAPLAFQERWQRYMNADHDFSRMLETSIAEGAGPGTGMGMGVHGGVPFNGSNGVGDGYGSRWSMGQMNSGMGTSTGAGMGMGANTYTPGVSYPLLPAAPRTHPYQQFPSTGTGTAITSPSPSSLPTPSGGLTTDLSAQIRADLMRIMANRSRMRTGISNEVEAIKALGDRLNKEKSRNRWKAFQK